MESAGKHSTNRAMLEGLLILSEDADKPVTLDVFFQMLFVIITKVMFSRVWSILLGEQSNVSQS